MMSDVCVLNDIYKDEIMSTVELKGFKNLFGLDDLLAESKSDHVTKENIFHLPIASLTSGKYQPRLDIDDSSLDELVLSIKAQGILLPLIVRSIAPKRYEIIAGERRFRAAKLAGFTHVPALIREVPDETALAFALIENIQRESLNPIDEALALIRLKEEFTMTHEEIAERVGRSRSTVTNLMRLLGLPDEVKGLLRARQLEMGHARALLGLREDQQCEIAKKITQNHLSVRETEKLTHDSKQSKTIATVDPEWEAQLNSWEVALNQIFAIPVKVLLNTKGQGKVVLTIKSHQEIERLLRLLA